MPGISIIPSDKQEQYKNPITQDFPEYELQVFEAQDYYISSFAAKDYPLAKFENDQYKVIIEGFIFSEKEHLEKQIYSIAQSFFEEDSDAKLKAFVSSTDGEYIVCLLNKQSRELFVFNDYLGRLPFYYYQAETEWILSREISYLTQNVKAEVNKEAGAEMLLFGFPLGHKTLHNNCFKLRPAQYLRIAPQKAIHIKSLIEHNFELENSKADIQTAAKQAAQLFVEATKNRIQHCPNHILSLSGGLDSRAVMSALHQNETTYKALSYDNKQQSAKKDITIAKALCNAFNTELKFHLLAEPQVKDRQLLLKIKQGLNYLGMSYLIPFFKKEQQAQTFFWTGDGGDKIFPDLRPLRLIFSMNDLVDYIYKKHRIHSYSSIENELGIKKIQLKQQIRDTLESYPEKSFKGKYKHFILMERAHNWLFEGEDRNRYFMPNITPFYAIPLFQYCMEVPDKQKANFKFFKAFLEQLDPKLNTIANANWDTSISDSSKVKWIYFKQKVKSWIAIFRTFENSSSEVKAAYLNTLKKF